MTNPKCDMKASLTDDISMLNGEEWGAEMKFDGVRAKAEFNGGNGGTQLFNPYGEDITFRYPELNVPELNGDMEIDGEIIIGNGTKTDFQQLQKRMNLSDTRKIAYLANKEPVKFVAFDLLSLAGGDMSKKRFEERRSLLSVAMNTRHIYSNSQYRTLLYVPLKDIPENYPAKLKQAGYEGIMLKHIDSRYEHGKRSKRWLKYKFLLDVDCVIIGWTQGTGWRDSNDLFGALVLGMYENGTLREVGKVGTGRGLTEHKIRELKAMLIDTGEKEIRGKDTIFWCDPDQVAKIKCLDITKNGNLRQPSFIGVRNDKRPEECMVGVY